MRYSLQLRHILAIVFVQSFLLNVFRSYSQCSDHFTGNEESLSQWGFALDNNDNAYFGGSFADSITIGGQHIDVPNGNYFFVAKLKSSGSLDWLRYFQNSFINYIFTPQIAWYQNQLYIGGAFGDQLSDEFGQSILSYPGYYAAFVMKLNPSDGQVVNSKVFGSDATSSNYMGLFGVTVSAGGKIFATGLFRGNMYLDAITLSSPLKRRCWVARLDTNLNVIWAKNSTHTSATASYFSRGYAIKTDSKESVIVGGMTWKDIAFDGITFTTDNDFGWNPFIAKLDSSGNCLWIDGGKGPEFFDNVYALGIDESDNVFMSSPMDSTITFGGTTLYPSNGRLYFNKYDADGNLLWTKQDGATEYVTQLYNEIIPHNNQITVGGWVNVSASLDAFTIPPGSFAATADVDGNWEDIYPTYGLVSGYETAKDSAGNIFMSGNINSDSVAFHNTEVSFTDSARGAFALKICLVPTGIAGVEESNSFSVAPNPANDKINVNLSKTERGNVRLEIFTVQGQSIYTAVTKGNTVIDLHSFPVGFYIVKLIGEGKIYSVPLIIQR